MSAVWWMELAQQAARIYTGHPCFDDLLSEAYVAAWAALRECAAADRSGQRRAVWRAARNQAMDFIRSPRNLYRRHTRGRGHQGVNLPELVPLTEWQGIEPDFVPRLLARLDWEEWMERLRLTERERTLLRLVAEGYPLLAAGQQIGVSESRAGQIMEEIRQWRRQGYRPQNCYLRGVFPQRNRYRAQVSINDRKLSMGTWDTPEEAAVVVDAVTIAFGLGRPLNLLPEHCR